jgi:hypothetical protein
MKVLVTGGAGFIAAGLWCGAVSVPSARVDHAATSIEPLQRLAQELGGRRLLLLHLVIPHRAVIICTP